MKKHPITAALLMLALQSASSSAQAATIRVENWGADTPDCGSKATPCETIQHAVTFRSSPNDKVLVGPGYYEEAVVINQNAEGDDLNGLKLQSTNGLHTTIIRTSAANTHGIHVQQPNVQIGKKGKGFTVGGADSAGYAAIRVDAVGGKVRVEGNRTILSHYGVIAFSENIQLRHNLVEYNQIGVQCTGCVNGLVRDNTSRRNMGNGYVFNLSDGVSIQRNSAAYNASRGFNIGNTTEFVKLQHNVSEFNALSGYMVNDIDGATVQGNIALLNQANGFAIQQDALTSQPRIMHNLAIANNLRGIEFYDLIDGKVENNSAVSNQYGFRLNAGVSAATFKGNNSVASITGCAIQNQSGSMLHVEKQYYGDAIGPDDALDGDDHDGLCGADPTGDGFSTRPNRSNARKAQKL